MFKCFHPCGGIPSEYHSYPYPLICSFHREGHGYLITWQQVSQRGQSKRKYSKLSSRLCKAYMVKCLHKLCMSMSAALCSLFKSQKPAQAQRHGQQIRPCDMRSNTLSRHGRNPQGPSWRPPTNHVIPSSFPLLSSCLCFITKICLL